MLIKARALTLVAVLVGGGTRDPIPAATAAPADDSTLVVEVAVRHGRAERFQTGDVVTMRVREQVDTFGIAGGTIRIRSTSTRYDSGAQPLVFEADGRSLYFHWSTSALRPVSDYRARVTVTMKAGGTRSREVLVGLHPVVTEETILERTTDLSLPYWDLGLHLTRSYQYESGYGIYKGALGYGWTFTYGVELTEFTDGSVAVFDPGRGGGRRYTRIGPGRYASPPGDLGSLTRDPDGSFTLRLANGNRWRFGNDLKPRVLENAWGRRIGFEFDRVGRLAAVSDLSGQRIVLGYDDQGRVVSASDPGGRRVAYRYDARGDLEAAVDVAGEVTMYAYDGDHRLTRIRFADGLVRTFEYGTDGRLSRVFYTGGAGLLVFRYDLTNPAYGERTITDALGRTTRQLTTGDGFLVSTTDALDNTVRFEYDARFTPVRFISANGQRWDIEENDARSRIQITDPLGAVTRLAYLPEAWRLAGVVDGNGRETRFLYRPGGELGMTVYPDGTTELRQIRESATAYTVDRTTRSGNRNRYTFDLRGLLLSKELSDGSKWVYVYDMQGNMTEATNADGTIAMAYDRAGRLIRVTYPGGRSFRYDYDQRSRRRRMEDPDGRVLTYTRTSNGQLSRITQDARPVADYQYNDALQVTGRVLGNGVSRRYGYDGAGRLVSLTDQIGGRMVSSWSYQLDPSGTRTAKSSPDGTETYQFDHLSRLTSVTYPNGLTERFEYDAVGNRRAVDWNGRRSTIVANSLNQYTLIGTDSLTYDRAGNLIGRSIRGRRTQYVYDPENRLVQVVFPDASTIRYTYDAIGRLRSREDARGKRMFLWDLQQVVIEEDTAHRVLRSYTWGDVQDELLEITQGPVRLFASQDALASVTELTDIGTAVLERHRYRVFGDPGPAENASGLLFSAAYFDYGTEFVYMRNRWYSPGEGRFVQADPIGLRGGPNLYTYAFNNPTTYRDPLGLTSSSDNDPHYLDHPNGCPECDTPGGPGHPPPWIPTPFPSWSLGR
jgi:RHS repeat-associated protein